MFAASYWILNDSRRSYDYDIWTWLCGFGFTFARDLDRDGAKDPSFRNHGKSFYFVSFFQPRAPDLFRVFHLRIHSTMILSCQRTLCCQPLTLSPALIHNCSHTIKRRQCCCRVGRAAAFPVAFLVSSSDKTRYALLLLHRIRRRLGFSPLPPIPTSNPFGPKRQALKCRSTLVLLNTPRAFPTCQMSTPRRFARLHWPRSSLSMAISGTRIR